MSETLQKFPNVVDIRACEGVFILKTDGASVCYQNFENLAQDVQPKIRPEFKLDTTADFAGTC